MGTPEPQPVTPESSPREDPVSYMELLRLRHIAVLKGGPKPGLVRALVMEQDDS